MEARAWLLVALAGAALAAPACALILGAEELPEGTGGATATTSSSTKATSSSGSASTSSSAASASSGGGMCAKIASCRDCAGCMLQSVCLPADAGCTDGSMCLDYTECVVQCPQDGGFAQCAMGCNGTPPAGPGYGTVKACTCAQCSPYCTGYCQ